VGLERLLTFEVAADVAQLVEHHLAKVRVAGSNPVVRSKKVLLRWGVDAPDSAPRLKMRIRVRIHGSLRI
jgi:hypothetical protein